MVGQQLALGMVGQQLALGMVGLEDGKGMADQGKVGQLVAAAVLDRVAVEWGKQLTAGWDRLTVA